MASQAAAYSPIAAVRLLHHIQGRNLRTPSVTGLAWNPPEHKLRGFGLRMDRCFGVQNDRDRALKVADKTCYACDARFLACSSTKRKT